jgi:hypothetical protein
MEMLIGFLLGALTVFVSCVSIMNQWKKDLELLKDFDTWEKWRNKQNKN